jgi:hypothetical protein
MINGFIIAKNKVSLQNVNTTMAMNLADATTAESLATRYEYNY